jgi:hypothetical protein
LLRWGLVPSELPKAGGLEACAAAFTRLRPRRVFAPGFSKDGAAPHLLKQRPKGEPCRRKIGDRRAFSDATGTVFRAPICDRCGPAAVPSRPQTRLGQARAARISGWLTSQPLT